MKYKDKTHNLKNQRTIGKPRSAQISKFSQKWINTRADTEPQNASRWVFPEFISLPSNEFIVLSIFGIAQGILIKFKKLEEIRN